MNDHADEAACVRLQVEANPHTGQISLSCLPHWSLPLVIEATTAILTEQRHQRGVSDNYGTELDQEDVV